MTKHTHIHTPILSLFLSFSLSLLPELSLSLILPSLSLLDYVSTGHNLGAWVHFCTNRMYVYNCTTKTSTNLPFSESEHAWHKILRGAGHGDIASGPRIAQARAAFTRTPRRHKPAAGAPGVP